MRLRNVKGASQLIKNSPYVFNDYANMRGKWSSVFGNSNPIHVEIGMGKGKFIIESARKNPDINYIGIERFDSVLVRAIQKLDRENLANLRILKVDAECIDQLFVNEITELYLNFSDPWPKKKHEKRRLTSTYFLNKYENIFKDEQRIVMKTDNRHLFEFSIISMVNFGYHIEELILNLYDEDITLNIATEYEQKFSEQGYPIYKVVVSK